MNVYNNCQKSFHMNYFIYANYLLTHKKMYIMYAVYVHKHLWTIQQDIIENNNKKLLFVYICVSALCINNNEKE